MENEESVLQKAAREAREKREKSKTNKKNNSSLIRLTGKDKDDFNMMKDYLEKTNNVKLTKVEVIKEMMSFYNDSIIKQNITRAEATNIFYTNINKNHILSSIRQDNKVSIHLLLAIIQNIGLQGLDEEHAVPIIDYIDNLSQDNSSSQIYKYIKRMQSNEEHSNKLKRK